MPADCEEHELRSLCREVSHSLKNKAILRLEFMFKAADPTWKNSCCDRHLCFLTDCCLSGVLLAVANSPNNVSQIFEASSMLKRILTIMNQSSNVAINIAQEDGVLSFIFKYWDFVMDVVCHDCSEIFSLLIRIHIHHCPMCSNDGSTCEWVTNLTSTLFASKVICRSRFKCMLLAMETMPSLAATHYSDSFLARLYNLLGNPSLSVAISDLIGFDMECRELRWDLHIQFIISHLTDCANGSGSSLRQAIIERLLPKVCKSAQLSRGFLERLMAVIKEMPLTSDASLSAVLAITKFVIFVQKRSGTYKVWSNYVSDEAMSRSVMHRDLRVRLSAWYLLCEHPKRTQLVSAQDCRLIEIFVVSNMAEQSPAARQKIFASFKKLLTRLCEVTEGLAKGRIQCASSELLMNEYSSLISRVADLSFQSLAPGASVCRRLTALSLIEIIFVGDSLNVQGKGELLNRLNLPSMLTPARRLLVMSCLDDSYQLCQNMALGLLNNLRFEGEFNTDEFIETTKTRMLSMRSHDTLSSGYRYRFLINKQPELRNRLLDEMISLCEERLRILSAEGISTICAKATLHPILSTIALLLEYLGDLIDSEDDVMLENLRQIWSTRLLKLCMSIASHVRPVVHSLSPEGYIPEDIMANFADREGMAGGIEATKLYSETSQILLVCCWRAHKHVSGILAWAAAKLPFPQIMTVDDMRLMGDYYWAELTECKHCGAFESAVEGFEALCKRLWKECNPELPNPMHWLHKILDALDGEEDLDRLCSTRRSAGLPHLVVSICVTEAATGKALAAALSRLLVMEHKSEAYRIHCLNVLKTLFSNARLGDLVLPALEEAVRVAIHGCGAASWSERNASAQLVSSLLIRVFGVTRSAQRDLHVDHKNRMSAFEFFSRFPSLYAFIYDHISSAPDEFSVYPALILLTHLFPSTSHQYPLTVFIPVVMKILLSARAEKLRRLAVAALHSISTQEDLLFLLEWVNTCDLSTTTQNNIDGVLNLMSTIATRSTTFEDGKKIIRQVVSDVVERGIYKNWCDYTLNQLCELIILFGLDAEDMLKLDVEAMILSRRPLAKYLLECAQPNEKVLNCAAMRLEIYRLVSIESKVLDEKWSFLMQSSIEDLRNETTNRRMNYIFTFIYLNASLLTSEQKGELLAVLEGIKDKDLIRITETEALYRRLRLLLCDWKLSVDDVDWLKECTETESEETMQIAINIIERAIGREQDCCVPPLLAGFLQDSDAGIRDLASSVVSPHLIEQRKTGEGGASFILNPTIAFALLAKKYPEILDDRGLVTVDTVEDKVLFDQCVRNSYAETVLFGDFSIVEEILERT